MDPYVATISNSLRYGWPVFFFGVYEGWYFPPCIVPSTQCASLSKDRPGGALGFAPQASQGDMSKLEQKRKSGKPNGIQTNAQVGKQARKQQRCLKWGNLDGVQKVCMGAHQYEIPVIKRIVQLGICPSARGSVIPTARIESHMVEFGQV